MPTKITGGCACGAIRYEVTADPIVMFNCHCRDCQKTSGGPYTPVFYAPANAFKVTKGTPKYYTTTSEMIGDNVRGFCPECGTRLFGGKSDFGQGIAAGTLDDPSLYKPQHEIWTSDAQPWDAMDPKLSKFEKYAPGE
jgi:hypothetical protein